MKLLITSMITASSLWVASSASAQSLDLPGIPSNASSFYYTIGGGSVVSQAPTYSDTFRSNVTLNYGFGYSCGAFDPITDVESIIEDLVDTVTSTARAIPQHLMKSLTAAISAMPGYLLNKANPSLYNTLMKGYDDSFELIELSYKSCKQMETEIADGKNPYQNLITASIAENWQYTAGLNNDPTSGVDVQTIDEVAETIKDEGADKGLKLFAGNRYGGIDQDPIRINYLTTLVGYNVLTNHSPVDDPAHTPPATETVGGESVSVLLPAVWPSSGAAAEWIIDVIGDTSIILTEEGTTSSKAGKGLRTRVLEESFEIREALTKAVVDNNFDDIRQPKYDAMLKISGNLVHAIRQADPFDQAVMIDRISTELAVKLMVDTVVMAKQLLMAGLHESNLVLSSASDVFEDHIRTRSIADLDSAVTDILNDLKLRENTFASTPKLIIQEAEAAILNDVYRRGAAATPIYGQDQDGAVRK